MGQAEGPQGGSTVGATRFSPDGYWWWDGSNWRPTASPDGAWRWDGQAWVTAAGARPQPKGPRPSIVVALVAAGTILVLVAASILTYALVTRLTNLQKTTASRTTASGIPCDLLEHTQVHYHAALQILNQGAPVDIPTGLGRTFGCFYWIHMHDFEPGIIHIESPTGRAYTLGDFFSVWASWSGQAQPLNSTHVGSLTLTSGETLVTYVDPGDGRDPQVFTGDPNTIVLASREVITLEITPPAVRPPAFAWPGGF